MLLRDLLAAHTSSRLLNSVSLSEIDQFLRFACSVKQEILLHVPHISGGDSGSVPPYRLPQYIHDFLQNLMQWTDAEVIEAWSIFRFTVWDEEQAPHLSAEEISLFDYHGAVVARSDERLGKSWSVVLLSAI
jgi:hypothetical protein